MDSEAKEIPISSVLDFIHFKITTKEQFDFFEHIQELKIKENLRFTLKYTEYEHLTANKDNFSDQELLVYLENL